MTVPTAFQVNIHKGKAIWRDKEGLAALLPLIEGRRMIVTFHEPTKQQTDAQRGYFHGVVCERISDYTGWEVEEVKILLKYLFLSREGKNGRLYVRGTSKLTRREYSQFIDRVIRWSAIELDLYIPPAETCAESYLGAA